MKELGHKKALCIADNFICVDKERIEGFRKAFEQGETYRWEIPKTEIVLPVDLIKRESTRKL